MEEDEIIESKKKEQTFRGKTLGELTQLGVREFAKILPSGRKRNVLRNFQEHEKFLTRVKEKLQKGKKLIKTHKRDLVIMPELVGVKMGVYNGRDFVPVEITFEMLGHKLGEFSISRAKTKHSKEDKSGKKKAPKKE